MIFIAEVKIKSPFGFTSDKSWHELFDIANLHGDWISIHTNPLWGGSFELLKMARSMTSKPLLAKGLHPSDEDIKIALELGADYVLVVGRIPEIYIDKCIVEPLLFEELSKIPNGIKTMWNSRDLSTGLNKINTFEEARILRPDLWMIQASNIKCRMDIHPKADAFVVGSSLPEFCNGKKRLDF